MAADCARSRLSLRRWPTCCGLGRRRACCLSRAAESSSRARDSAISIDFKSFLDGCSVSCKNAGEKSDGRTYRFVLRLCSGDRRTHLYVLADGRGEMNAAKPLSGGSNGKLGPHILPPLFQRLPRPLQLPASDISGRGR
jgi:hypothetical protein